MKIRIIKGVHLHLGTPWKEGSIVFGNTLARDWDVSAMWGLSLSRWPFGFMGWIAMDPRADKVLNPRIVAGTIKTAAPVHPSVSDAKP